MDTRKKKLRKELLLGRMLMAFKVLRVFWPVFLVAVNHE